MPPAQARSSSRADFNSRISGIQSPVLAAIVLAPHAGAWESRASAGLFRSKKRAPAPAKKTAARSPSLPELDALREGLRVYAPETAGTALDQGTLNDLEVFKEGHGLFTILDKTKTAFGKARLERLLRNPLTDAHEIRRRQDAVRELMRDSGMRRRVEEAFARLGGSAGKALRGHALLEKNDSFIFFPANAMNLLLAGLLFLSFGPALMAGGMLNWRSLGQPLMIMAWLFASVYKHLRASRNTFLRYKAVFALAGELSGPLSQSRSDALREIGGVFSATRDKGHPLKLAGIAGSLSRVLPHWATLALDFLYYHSAKTLWRLSRRIFRARARIAHLLGALGELDLFLTLARRGLDETRWSHLPEILDGDEPSVSIEDGHHPALAADDASVGNSLRLDGRAHAPVEVTVEWDARSNFLVLTGANMGGKSTFLKTIALHTLLAQIGAPVPARSMRATPVRLGTSIEIIHSLAEGKSLYDAETDRIRAIIDRAEKEPMFLGVLDEVLQGTNPDDRIAIERAIVRYLARTGRLFLVATHNLKITSLEGEVPGLRNIHVEEKFVDGKMVFSYKILPGPATTRNAVATLKEKGFPEEIINEALAESPPDEAGPAHR